MKKNKLKILLTSVISLFIITSCSAPDEYLEKTGGVNNKQTTLETGSLTHPVDEDSEGYYIADKYWYSGELVDGNKTTGEIWSFDAKAGQQYAVYVYYKTYLWVFEGSSKSNFKSDYLKPCEQMYKYTTSVDLYGRPAVVTPEKDGRYYLKVWGAASNSSTTFSTGKYDICVTKGRDGESFVPLTMESVAPDAWVEGELLFNKKEGWYDYENGTTSDWSDYDCYVLDVNAGDQVVLYGCDKTNSSYTAKTGFSASYWNGSTDDQIFKEGYEYVDNDSSIDGYPFTVPDDIALKDGETKKHIYWYVAPSLEDGATKVTVDGENIGTYRVAAKINDEYVSLEANDALGAYQYQLIISDTTKLAVGAVFNPFEFASLKKWDGTVVSSSDENLYIYWGDGFEKLTNYVYLLCKEEKSHTYLQFSYPTDGVTYYYYKYVNIAGEDDQSLKINVVDSSVFCVGNYGNATVTYKGNDITSDSTAYWAWINPNAENPKITKCETNGQIPCTAEGTLYIMVQEQAETDDIVFKEVTVKPASENPYQIEIESGSVEFLNTATFALKVNGSDVSNTAVWTCSDSIDFDTNTHVATFYASGVSAYINAEYNGVKTYYKCTIEDRDTYNLTFDIPLDKIDFGSSFDSYTVNLSGTYDETKFNLFTSKLESITKPFILDMSNVTGITVLNRPSEDSNDGLFAGCTSMKTLKLPQSLTTLGVSCLRNCTSLVSVTIPDSVTSFENYALAGCSSLTSITIPEGVVTLGDSEFYGCTSLTSVKFPSTLTTIGKSIFGNCTSLTTMTIPDTVTSLSGVSTFYGCSNLRGVSLPDNCMNVMANTFNGCTYLNSVTVPAGVTILNDSVFDGCSSLTNVSLPSAITYIGNFCFRDCIKLKSITLPSSLTEMDTYCFKNCQSLTSITIPSKLEVLTEGCFVDCSNLSSVSLSNITTIGKYAFYKCTSLTTVTLPWSTIETIGLYAFSGCSNLSKVVASRTFGLKKSFGASSYSYTIYGSSVGNATLAYYLRDLYDDYIWCVIK